MNGLLIFNPALIFFLLASLIYLIAISRVLNTHGWREEKARLLVIYCLLTFCWTAAQALAVFFPILNSSPWFLRLLVDGLLGLAIIFGQLNRAFLRQEERGSWIWWAGGAGWLLLVGILTQEWGLLAPMLPIGVGIPRIALGTDLAVLGWGGFLAIATLQVFQTYRRVQQPLHRNRIKYWTLALVVTVTGGGLFLLGYAVVGSSLYLFGTLNFAYAVLNYHLPDVRLGLRRTFSTMVLTLVAILFYAVALWGFYELRGRIPGFSVWGWVGLTAVLLAIALNPLLVALQKGIRSLILRAGYDSSRLMRDYSMSISNVLDLDRLALISTGLICSGMGLRRGMLFVVHVEPGEGETEEERLAGGAFGLRGIGVTVPEIRMPFQDPVGKYLGYTHECLNQYDIDLLPRFERTASEVRSWLARLEMDVYVPIYAKGEWIGLFALGPKVSGDRYFEQDFVVLSTLADQTAVALENARLFDDLRLRTAEIQRLNDELTAANQELARLDQAKTDFITIASHELRTPLTRIRGYNDILGQMLRTGTLLPETGQQLTQGVGKAVQHLEEIVNTMFLVSRISTSTLNINASLTSVSTVMRTAVDMWGDALVERKQSLVLEQMDELPYITADGKRLKEAFSHLIQNAIKYTPDGGKIWVRGRLVGAELPLEEQQVEIVVADSGIGVGAENAERIFEKFYRASDVSLHSTGDTKFKGAGPGLGLTIARGIVEAHRGKIWVESKGFDEQLCPGSEFHVLLPVRSRLVNPEASGEAVEVGVIED